MSDSIRPEVRSRRILFGEKFCLPHLSRPNHERTGARTRSVFEFIVAIEPWLGEVVLVGGWAHRLYRLDPRARKLDYLPLTTLDGDVAVPPTLKKEESTVRKRLLEAGFELTRQASSRK